MKFNTKLILPLFIIGIMLFSGVGFLYTSNADNNVPETNVNEFESVEFKNKTFVKTEQGYRYKNVDFMFSPEELDNVWVNVNNLNFDGKVYLSINESIPNVASKLPFAGNLVGASYDDETSRKFDIPLKDCADANETKIIKLISKGNESKDSITQDGNCYILEGNMDLVIERFILEVLGWKN